MDKVIFLSHIHEEKALALLLKNAIEEEFSGFVGVFVSSDGMSIPAGANFLQKIENGLVDCVGAIYLISPISVKRNWINFELGAVWIRNILNLRAGNPDIPTLPICHSGSIPSELPAPLNNLVGITASQSSHVESAFRSLQRALGGSGKLRTDFDGLAAKIREFEFQYTIGANLEQMFRLLSTDNRSLVQHCESQPPDTNIVVKLGFVETNVLQALKAFESNHLKGSIRVTVGGAVTEYGSDGVVNRANVDLTIPVSLIVRFKDRLLSRGELA